METKICKKCNEELTIDKFGIARKGDKEYIRNVCKTCHNNQSNQKRRSKQYKPNLNKDKGIIIDGMEKPNYKVEKRNDNLSNIFNSQEIETLKNLIEDYPVIKNLKDNKIILEKSLNKKSIRTFNLDDDIYIILKNKSEETNLSISDIANTLLKKAIEYL